MTGCECEHTHADTLFQFHTSTISTPYSLVRRLSVCWDVLLVTLAQYGSEKALLNFFFYLICN